MRPAPPAAIALIRRFESCKLTAYQDVAGVWTIGFGNTRHAKPGLIISQSVAEVYFSEDIAQVGREIACALRPEILLALSDDQYGALCSFAFNLGVRPREHAIWTLINASHFDRVPGRLLLYNKAVVAGRLVPVAGLTRRRRAEAEMWQTDGDEIVLTARLADIKPTSRVEKKLGLSRRLWLGLSAAVSTAGNWAVEHVKIAGEWAGQLQTLVAPQIAHSEFLAKVSSALAMVAVASGAAIMLLQAQAHKDLKS